jgi:hypothetical protein
MSALTNALVPELAFEAASGVSRRRLAWILGATVVFMIAVAIAVFMLLGHEETTARHATGRFAAALVHDDQASAPAGGAAYVSGVRAYFGPVTSTAVIDAHNHSVNTGDTSDTRSYFVTELLLQTRRGPAVVELSFDNHSLSSEEVTSVRELAPNDARGLSTAQRAQLVSAFRERGGHAAADATLSAAAPTVIHTSTHTPVHATPVHVATVHADSPRLSVADRQLRCVQHAHGDVAKLQRCAGS